MDANPDTIRVGGWILTPDPDAATRNPGTRLEHAEALRRFAHARTLNAITDLHDHAQRTMPRHLADLQTAPGMGVSARTGTLVTRLGTEAAIEEVAWAVGYEDPAAFRRLFRRMVGLTPGGYRRRFQLPPYAQPPGRGTDARPVETRGRPQGR